MMMSGVIVERRLFYFPTACLQLRRRRPLRVMSTILHRSLAVEEQDHWGEDCTKQSAELWGSLEEPLTLCQKDKSISRTYLRELTIGRDNAARSVVPKIASRP